MPARGGFEHDLKDGQVREQQNAGSPDRAAVRLDEIGPGFRERDLDIAACGREIVLTGEVGLPGQRVALAELPEAGRPESPCAST